MIIFYFIIEGECFVEMFGEVLLWLVVGDVVLFLYGDVY